MGLEFELHMDDMIIPKLCPLLGIAIASNGKMNNRDSSPSIDRIDSKKGYTPDNVWIVSYRANRIKNDASLDELKLIAANLTKKTQERTYSR